MKTKCDYLYGWIKKTVTCTKISPKMVNPRDIAGNAEEEEEESYNTIVAIKKNKIWEVRRGRGHPQTSLDSEFVMHRLVLKSYPELCITGDQLGASMHFVGVV